LQIRQRYNESRGYLCRLQYDGNTIFFGSNAENVQASPAVLHENFVLFLSRFQDARHRVDAIWLTTDCMQTVYDEKERPGVK